MPAFKATKGLAMNISPATGALGAHVDGLDLTALDATQFAALKSALDEHLVLYVAGQDLDRHQLSALGRRFGPLFRHPIVDNGFADCPEVLELLREPEDKIMFGGESWHADITWMNPAGYVSILHGIELPPVGGDTAFASNIAAFETLSDGLKSFLRGQSAYHSYHWYEHREDPDYTALQPVVRRHPASGREGLYVNRMFTSRFDGMTAKESAPILDHLFAHMEQHPFTCRFRWQKGGVILWDNRFTLHYPINDFHGVRRRMIRTTSLEA
ncbi:MAG: taurine dioxygenase [Rhizobiales bacterium]|nr:taurine dioxygenase [Hyphomicrobiales bacterium]